ncbi:PAS domain-containing protein [Sphingomonas sp. TREG-RG-20F-R18-01]|uniref:PAS domain-containing protein n=1 Tax=Sphingomonas sp. TREG-RG-20F-R18-01 TaxID=2914982 RepID=UPI001F58920A|nr:PAS domain-containing protein [Sphingomonas sp. TREG-RG-20F-R18-01]
MTNILSVDAPIGNGWRIDEGVRAAAIAEHRIETLRDDLALKKITDFAAALCDAPIALVSIVELSRQTFLSRTGLGPSETPRETSFCAHAMVEDDIMVVPDARLDPRFADNPLVTGELGIRFYAGVPLVSEAGIPLGSLCVIAREPRDGLTDFQRQGLKVLADDVLNRLSDSRASAISRATIADSESRFRTLADSMPQMVWSTLPDGFHDYYNARWYEFTGMPAGSTDGDGWNDIFHPEDQARAWGVWRQSLETGEPYQIEYRLRHRDGTYRWTLGRALPMTDRAGKITRWIGTCTDIHEQKLASEEREVVAQELSHRIKNIFAVIAGLITFAARSRPEFRPIAEDLRHRVTALGRAHDFVRPHSAKSRPDVAQTSLHGLLDALFLPYQAVDAARISVGGADVPIDDRSATPLALLFHELATNATKYGALSNDLGSVTVTSLIDGSDIVLVWQEDGGPKVRQPETLGFGAQLIDLSASRQLGGTVVHDWAEDGLRVVIEVSRAALSRG